MENELDRFEALLKQHAYEALSQEEKAWVKQFVASPEEYDAMRRAGKALEEHFSEASTTEASPDPAVLASLEKQFQLRYSSQVQGRWSVPAWAAVLAITIAGGSGWYAGTSNSSREIYVDRIVAKTDTVRVASKADTVVLERIVYRNINTMIPASASQPAPTKTQVSKGVNMKEKEELEKLLVSGGL